jgi:hypothetical protein
MNIFFILKKTFAYISKMGYSTKIYNVIEFIENYSYKNID